MRNYFFIVAIVEKLLLTSKRIKVFVVNGVYSNSNKSKESDMKTFTISLLITILLATLVTPSISQTEKRTNQQNDPLVLINQDASLVILLQGNLADPKSVRAKAVTPIRIDAPVFTNPGPGPNPQDPPVEETFSSAVKKLLNAVPDHADKKDAQRLIAGIYSGVGQQYKAGVIPRDQLKSSLDSILDMSLKLMKVEQHWKEFRAGLTAELNRRNLLTVDQVNDAFQDVAVVVTPEGEAISDILPPVLKLIVAVISKDPAAITQAVIELIASIVGRQKASALLVP